MIRAFNEGSHITSAFTFENDELYTRFFKSVGIDLEKFQEKYYFYDADRKIHISESEAGYVWISTKGLTTKSKSSGNNYLNACRGQRITLMELLNKAISLCSEETVYDIDSFAYSQLEQITLALFHNELFFFETAAKAYLSLCKKPVPFTHDIDKLFVRLKQTMFEMQHNNTLFHAYIVPMFEHVLNHIHRIPGNFKEEYVKYDDNPQDTTILLYDLEQLKDTAHQIQFIFEAIESLYYGPNDRLYFRPNLYQQLLRTCRTEEDRLRIQSNYEFLLDTE